MLYLIRSGEYTKVGYTCDFSRRIKEYKTDNPNFEVLGLREGDLEDEKQYHLRFRDYPRIRKEWFLLPEEVVKFIKLDFNIKWGEKKDDKFYEEAVKKLGEKEVKRLGTKRKIRKAIINKDMYSLDLKNVVQNSFELDVFYSLNLIKERLKKIYSELDIAESPKAVNINRWFECDALSKRIDGKVTKGYILKNRYK